MKYDALTPYSEQNPKTVKGNLEAFGALLRLVPPPTYVGEAMGGLGYQSKEIQALWRNASHHAWERNDTCFEELNKVSGVQAHLGEYPLNNILGPHSLLVLDFNLFTLKHADELKGYFKNRAEYVLFTDTARGKLHLHPQAYGLMPGADWSDYCVALNRWLFNFDLSLVGMSKAPRSITYFLARRNVA